MVFFSSLFANRVAVATSMLLCVAVAHVVLWSFASRCLQIASGWLKLTLKRASRSYFLWLWRRDPVLEQVLGQRRKS